jgi:hypothetical protein
MLMPQNSFFYSKLNNFISKMGEKNGRKKMGEEEIGELEMGKEETVFIKQLKIM